MRIAHAVLFLALFCVPAHAATYYATGTISDQDIALRMQAAGQMLDNQQTQAGYWEYGWGGFDAGTMVWSTTQAMNAHDYKVRGTDIVQAGESFIGLADVIFRPLPAFSADEACDALEYNPLQCLAARERMLQESAERAHEPYELWPHLGNAGFNLAAGLLVWRIGGAGRALATAVPGELVGELQLWTIPGGPINDNARYRLEFSPLVIQTGRDNNPATGMAVSFHF